MRAIVVGTGAGGATAARELALMGFDVVVLEAGRPFKPFTRKLNWAAPLRRALDNSQDGLDTLARTVGREQMLSRNHIDPARRERATDHWNTHGQCFEDLVLRAAGDA